MHSSRIFPRSLPLLGAVLSLLSSFGPGWAGEGTLVPLFSHSFAIGRLVLADGAGRLFILSKPEGTVSRLDPRSWTLSPRLSGLNRPQDIAVGRFGNRILLDLDSSRSLLIIPSKGAGPPYARTVGLNPGQIISGADDRYYLAAKAVHIIYALDPERYAPRNWMAVGETFRRASIGMDGHLWLPLPQSDDVMEVGTDPLTALRTIDLDRCTRPVRVLPLSSGGFLAGCHNAILREDASGDALRYPLSSRFRRGVQDLIAFPGEEKFLAIFHKSDKMVVFDTATMKKELEFQLPFKPVRLYIFPNWPILFVVMDDPDHDKSWLFGYPLSIFPHRDNGSPVTSILRKIQ